MNKIKKAVISSTAFTVILVMCLLFFSVFFQPKNNIKVTGMQDGLANGILAEPKNSIDVLFLGSSEAYNSFIPLRIWEKCGVTSYVCGTPGQVIYYSEEFLRKAFEYQSPKIVFLETDAVFRTIRRTDALTAKMCEKFSVFRYHNRWKSLSSEDFRFKVNYTYINNTKGYVYDNTVAPADVSGYMLPTDKVREVSSKNKKYVKQMKEFCEKHNAKLVLVSVPTTLCWNTESHNGMVKAAEELGLEFYDFNTCAKEIGIDLTKHSRDKGDHLNYAGAKIITDKICEYIKEQKVFSGKTDESVCAEWDKALAEFKIQTGENKKTV